MTSTLRWVGLSLVIASGLVGCTNSALDNLESQRGTYARLDCACHWMEDGYASESDCVTAALSEDVLEPCERQALEEDPAAEAYYACVVQANETLFDCLRASRCDEAMDAACYDAARLESGRCPAISVADSERIDARIDECRVGPPGRCPDSAISGAAGTIASGTTLGAGADLTGSCGGSEAPDRAFTWTAPSSGVWTFDTNGSDYDTLLYAVMSCGGAELACDDDDGDGLQSQITLTLTAGQTIVLVVDGYSDHAGDFVLNVTGG